MKRLIPVLAIALILVLCTWDDASSMRYPELRKETVQWDHPWGGEQHNIENPPFTTVSPQPETELGFFDIFKTWYNSISSTLQYRYFNNFGGKTTTTTTEIKPETQPTDGSNQVTTQKGSGQ